MKCSMSTQRLSVIPRERVSPCPSLAIFIYLVCGIFTCTDLFLCVCTHNQYMRLTFITRSCWNKKFTLLLVLFPISKVVSEAKKKNYNKRYTYNKMFNEIKHQWAREIGDAIDSVVFCRKYLCSMCCSSMHNNEDCTVVPQTVKY